MLLAAFNPTPTQTDAALDALADPTLSLLDIAKAHKTSLRALAAWLQTPEVLAHAQSINEALATRARSQAAATLPTAIAAATKSIEAFNQLQPPSNTDPQAADHYRRHCATALRAAWLLLRIARFDASPRRHSPHHENETPVPGRRRITTAPLDLTTLAALLNEHQSPPPATDPASQQPSPPEPSALAAPPSKEADSPLLPLSSLQHLDAPCLDALLSINHAPPSTSFETCAPVPLSPSLPHSPSPAPHPRAHTRPGLATHTAAHLAASAGLASGP